MMTMTMTMMIIKPTKDTLSYIKWLLKSWEYRHHYLSTPQQTEAQTFPQTLFHNSNPA